MSFINKKTVVLGASENPNRYSFLAVNKLASAGHSIVAIGKKEGTINDIPIFTGMPEVQDVDTVTLYLNPIHQKAFYHYILSLHPRRIIFNPGTENPELASLAAKNNIRGLEACTLVLLSTGQY
ncbi:MAG: CoA-binding protein [Bacteroidetes bacterium]|nr:CoA-binding protein [Bacteroidota bacterium]